MTDQIKSEVVKKLHFKYIHTFVECDINQEGSLLDYNFWTESLLFGPLLCLCDIFHFSSFISSVKACLLVCAQHVCLLDVAHHDCSEMRPPSSGLRVQNCNKAPTTLSNNAVQSQLCKYLDYQPNFKYVLILKTFFICSTLFQAFKLNNFKSIEKNFLLYFVCVFL